jgi:hypothetical protein
MSLRRSLGAQWRRESAAYRLNDPDRFHVDSVVDAASFTRNLMPPDVFI